MKARIVAMLLLAAPALTSDASAQGPGHRSAPKLAGRPASGVWGRPVAGQGSPGLDAPMVGTAAPVGRPAAAAAAPTAGVVRPSAVGRGPRLAGRAAPGADSIPAAPSVSPDLLAREVLAASNAARRRAGARALRADAALSRAARRYARELARRGEIEHLSPSPGRRTFRQRIEAEGARPRVAGENLARLTASTERLPGRVVRAWLASPGHRSNLLDPVFARTGVGVWLGADGVWYIVQVYATAT